MNRISEYLIRHLVSSVIGFPFIFLIWGWLNPLLNKLLIGEYPDVMFLPESGFFNCCCSVFSLFTFVAISTLAENLFVRKFAWKYWLHIPAFAVVIFVLTYVIWLPIGLALSPINWDAIFIQSIDNSVWGCIYWCIFTLSGQLLQKFMNSQS